MKIFRLGEKVGSLAFGSSTVGEVLPQSGDTVLCNTLLLQYSPAVTYVGHVPYRGCKEPFRTAV